MYSDTMYKNALVKLTCTKDTCTTVHSEHYLLKRKMFWVVRRIYFDNV